MIDKTIRLVEERGYAGTKYIPVIKQIVNYIQNRVYETYDVNVSDSDIKFEIPKKITSKIDIVRDLKILVTVHDRANWNEAASNSGGGSKTLGRFDKIINGKLENITIKIFAWAWDGEIFSRTVFNSLSHELNHVYEEYKRLLKYNDNSDFFLEVYNRNNASKRIYSFDKTINEYVCNVFYRLLNKSELNALINGVYGDLKGFELDGIEIDRKDFSKHIIHLQAYTIYKFFNDKFSYVFRNLEDDEWKRIQREYNSVFNKKIHNLDNFKVHFKNLIRRRLNDLMRGIGKVASYYYDVKDDEELSKINMIEIE